MNRTEKVRVALGRIQAVAEEAREPSIQDDVSEILAILDGCVVVPEKPTPVMKDAAFKHARRTTPNARAKAIAWDCVCAWTAMITAEEGE